MVQELTSLLTLIRIQYDLEMSPIRVNPANGDYVTVNADLTIESGVTIEIAEGKGILFNGACNKLWVNGTEELPVNFTDLERPPLTHLVWHSLTVALQPQERTRPRTVTSSLSRTLRT